MPNLQISWVRERRLETKDEWGKDASREVSIISFGKVWCGRLFGRNRKFERFICGSRIYFSLGNFGRQPSQYFALICDFDCYVE
jgi:hypothetical protein